MVQQYRYLPTSKHRPFYAETDCMQGGGGIYDVQAVACNGLGGCMQGWVGEWLAGTRN